MPVKQSNRPVRHMDMVELSIPIESEVVLADDLIVPGGIVDLPSFRRWAYSTEFPDHGRIDYLQGRIWVDLSMEQLYDHNQVKGAIFATLFLLALQLKNGRMFEDGTRLSLPASDISVEPDAIYVSFASFLSNLVREIPGRNRGETELEGSPDMLLEVVSDSSEAKDTIDLPDAYYRAGVREFWSVDARGDHLIFQILVRGDGGYRPSDSDGDWLRSDVFGKWFRLSRSNDQRGKASFELQVRD